MFAICSTKKDDVKNCCKAMMNKGNSYPIYQFGIKKYAELEKHQELVPEVIRAKKQTHLVTLMAGKIHKKTCKIAKRLSDAIEASIVRVDLTGLKKCKCMK